MTLGAAVVFRGHQARAFIPAAERRLSKTMRRYAPAVVVFAPCTGHHRWAIEQARALRPELGRCPMVFCGAHAEDFPEIVQEDGVDLLMIGDPETTLPELLFKISDERELPGTGGTACAGPTGPVFAAAREMIDDIDQLPQPDLEIYKRYHFVRNQRTLSFAVGRGVLENTHAGAAMGQAEWRRRFQPARRHSASEAMDRLNLARRRRAIYRRVAFRDDTFLLDPEPWRSDFLVRYRREVGLPFSCVGRADLLDGETVAALSEAGCARIVMDIGAGSGALREEAAGRSMPESLVEKAADRIKKAGIRLHTRTFVGHEGETEDDRQAALALNQRLSPDYAFAMPMHGAGGPTEEALRLALLFPLAVRSPRSTALLQGRATGLLKRVFQTHHDLGFVTSGELGLWDIARIGASMRR